MLRIRILTENYVRQRGLLAEHGLSYWIESDADRVMFDAGQTDVYARNALALGIDLTTARSIVISHGHYDHGGGLPHFPGKAHWPAIYLHPDAFLPKFARTVSPAERYQPIGFPWQVKNLGLDHQLALNTSTVQIGGILYACTGIEQESPFEKPAANLMTQVNGQMIVDDLHDEQMIVARCREGLVVLLGCSHPGVVNCLRHVRKIFPGQPIQAVIGGMHLEQADPERLRQTFAFFDELDIQRIVPLHCTGQQVIWQMKRELGDRVQIRCTGDEMTFH